MNNEEKLSILQSFFDDVEASLNDLRLTDDETLEEISYMFSQYKTMLRSTKGEIK